MTTRGNLLLGLAGPVHADGGAATGALREAQRGARIAVCPTVGHIWLGHDSAAAERVADLVRGTGRIPKVNQ
jgi:hypothetical protein